MIVDANILLYAADATSPHHDRAADWLTDSLNGHRRVGLTAQTLAAFLRISTHPRISDRPARHNEAWELVEAWLGAPSAWVPPVGERTMRVFGELVARHRVSGDLVPDAILAASAIEHGVPVVSADSDFARFDEVVWINPVRPEG